jgi:hypothetical protein
MTAKLKHSDDEIVICGGNAKPEDMHLASIVHCVDDEIIEWLKRRERQNERKTE